MIHQLKNLVFILGRFHEKLLDPHPQWRCQINFGAKDVDSFIPWLETNRQDLTIFVHALTSDNWKDHTEFAYWLGQATELNLSFFNTD